MRNRPGTQLEWKEFFVRREQRAAKNPVERFFFALDRDSEAGLMEANPALTPAERVTRRNAWAYLAQQIEIRLEQRFNRQRPSVGPDLTVVKMFSTIVRDAAKSLPSKSPLAKVMPDFGAGALGNTVTIGSGANVIYAPVCDVDSYFIWFFAEFALTAIEQDVDTIFWTNAAQPLIRCAFLFSRRFASRRPIQLLNAPGAPLTAAQRKEADLAFDALWITANNDPVRAMTLAMRASGTSYRA